MSGFLEDRALIMALTDEEAHELLAFLDAEKRIKPLPSSLEAALIAAVRCPDMSRYFLVQKSDRHVREAAGRSLNGPSCAVIPLRNAMPAQKPHGGHRYRF